MVMMGIYAQSFVIHKYLEEHLRLLQSLTCLRKQYPQQGLSKTTVVVPDEQICLGFLWLHHPTAVKRERVTTRRTAAQRRR